MPRVADHDRRRAQIAHGFQRVLAAEGFEGVSFKKVAAAAGLSVGLIQHYFASRDTLLRFAYDDAISGVGERMRARIRHGRAADGATAEVLLDSLLELVPLDEERTAEYRIRQNLAAQALHHPELAEVARRAGRDVLSYVTGAVQDGVVRGEVDPAEDAVVAARTILAGVQGVADQVALSGPDAFPAPDVLRRIVGMIFSRDAGERGRAAG